MVKERGVGVRRKEEGYREIGREKGRCRKDEGKNHNNVVIDTRFLFC